AGALRRRHASRRHRRAQQRAGRRRCSYRHRLLGRAQSCGAGTLPRPFGRPRADRPKRSERLTPKYRLIFFDVDSTLVTIEGIDVLAGGNPEVAKLTEAAMNGEVPLDQVSARRLEMIRPTRDAVATLAHRSADSLGD